MKVSIQMLSLGSIEIFFLFNHHHQPLIEIEGIQYSSLPPLLEKFPELHHPQHLGKLAQIANFLAKGIEFQYIEDIETFKEHYYQQIEAEQSSLLYEGPSLKDYGIFNLSVMQLPYFKDKQLVFFVRHDYLGIPYQVTLCFPIEKEPLEISYELLPLIH